MYADNCNWRSRRGWGLVVGLAALVIAGTVLAAPDDTFTEVRSYDARAALARIRQERGLDEASARTFFADHVSHVMGNGLVQNQPERPQAPCRWADDGSTLVCNATADEHRLIAESMVAFCTVGTAPVRIHLYFFSGRAADKIRLMAGSCPALIGPPKSPVARAIMHPLEQPIHRHEGTHMSRSQFVVEKDPTARCGILEDHQVRSLLDSWRPDMKAPEAEALSGHTVLFEDCRERLFLVGLDEIKPGVHEPRIRRMREGTALRVRPMAGPDGSIHVDFTATQSQVRSVKTFRVERKPATTEDVAVLEIPEVATHHVEGGADLRPGQWLLIDGLQIDAPQDTAEASWLPWPGAGRASRTQPRKIEKMLLLKAETVPHPAWPDAVN